MLGEQTPSVEVVPAASSSAGREAVDLAAMAGLKLDPWQARILDAGLGERPDGKWAAFEVGMVVPRQNGKGAVLAARQLAGLFLLGESLIIHSAHLFDTSLEAFRRLEQLIKDTPELHRRVRAYLHSHGAEGIELRSGQRIRFRARTRGGGRGFTADCLILDEAMYLPDAMLGALLPTLSARPNSQVWYAGSAVDQYVHLDGVHLARVRDRARSGKGESLAYFEWAAEANTPPEVEEEVAADPAVWARANPALGIRISAEHVENERQALDQRTFAVERLNVGDWPPVVGPSGQVLSLAEWDALEDVLSRPEDPVAFCFDVTPDRAWSSVAAAGLRADGLAHVEVVERQRGTAWLVERMVGLVEKHRPVGVVCDGAGPAGSLLPALQEAGVEAVTVTAGEHAQACGLLFDAVTERTVRHLGTQELRTAIKGASRRPLGDAWAWSRKQSNVDISPLVAVTLAHWLVRTGRKKPGLLMAVAFG